MISLDIFCNGFVYARRVLLFSKHDDIYNAWIFKSYISACAAEIKWVGRYTQYVRRR